MYRNKIKGAKSCWAKPLITWYFTQGNLMLLKDAFYSNTNFTLFSFYINLALSFFEKLKSKYIVKI